MFSFVILTKIWSYNCVEKKKFSKEGVIMHWNVLLRKVVKPSFLNLLNRFVEVVLQELVISGR